MSAPFENCTQNRASLLRLPVQAAIYAFGEQIPSDAARTVGAAAGDEASLHLCAE
jgi:hypothetical protein